MANEIVYYSSDEAGAPTLNNAPGSMIGVLDACLVDGFNAKPVTSIVVASGVATATISAHGLLTGRIYEFSGSTVTGGAPGALNGRQKITVVDANTVTFPAPGVADQAATGTITGKRPSLGWAKQFTGTNKAVYRRTDPQATATVLRIDDTGAGVASATQARAVMLEAASGIDDLSQACFQVSGGLYWSKGVNNTAAKDWILVGDSRTFYFWTEHDSYPISSYPGLLHFRAFGDLASDRAGDAYACLAIGDQDTSAASAGPYLNRLGVLGSGGGGFSIARRADTIGLAPWATFVGPQDNQLVGSIGPSYPSPVDNGLVLAQQILIAEDNSAFGMPIRGHARGLMAPLANIGNRLHRRRLQNLIGFNGDVLFVGTTTQGGGGCMAVDLTGPWI